MPSNGTKQAYDDVGFIVVHKRYYMGVWDTIELYPVHRTDSAYEWFRNSSFNDTHNVVGYTIKKVRETRAIFQTTSERVLNGEIL